MQNHTALLIASAALLAGCGNLRAIHHSSELEGSRAVFVDAQQRAIVTQPSWDGNPPVACAEPSPDAMSALAASASTNLSREDLGELQASLAMSESAANIGLRTPTIQLLRDGMYRLCESYMNGSIQRGNYLVLVNRYQQMMIGLVAIEQLTGVTRTSHVTIGGQEAFASSTMDLMSVAQRNLQQYQTRMDQIDRRLGQIDAQNVPDTSGESPSPQAQADATERTDEKARLVAERAVVQAAWERQTQHITQLSTLMAQTLARVTESSAPSAPVETPEGAQQQRPLPQGQDLAAVAEAVRSITLAITANNVREFACMPIFYYGHQGSGLTAAQFQAAFDQCINHLREEQSPSAPG